MKNRFLGLMILLVLFAAVSCKKQVQTYTVEDINDTDILKYPPPGTGAR